MNQPASKVRSFPDALDGTPGGELDQEESVNLIEEDFIDDIDEQDAEVANEPEAPTRTEKLLAMVPEERKKLIQTLCVDITNERAERDKHQGQVNLSLNEAETKGLHKQAVKDALKYIDADQKKKDAYMLTFRLVLEAFGQDIQQDLFLDQ